MKTLQRRTLLQYAGVAAATCWTSTSKAAAYPERAIRFVVGFPPGGTYDILARVFAERIAQRLEQPVFVENRAGANGAIALSQVARMPADGYALTQGSLSAQILNPLFNPNLQYNPERDFSTVAMLAKVPTVLAVRRDLPARNLRELVQLLKKEQLTYATPGIGSAAHLAAVMFSRSLGVKMLHVPFQGDAPGIQEVMAGRVDMSFTLPVSVLPHASSGRVRVLGTASRNRSAVFPEVPTFAQAGIMDAEADVWFTLIAPAAVPDEIKKQLNAAVVSAASEVQVRARLFSLGATPDTGSMQEVTAFVDAERRRWGTLVRESGVLSEQPR